MLRCLPYQLLLPVLLSSCAEPAEPVGLTKPQVFDLGAVLENQIKLLTAEEAGVTKMAAKEGSPTESTTQKKVNWQRELEIFSQASISRPAWRNEYAVDTVKAAGNTHTIRYSRISGSKATVEYLTLQLGHNNQPLRTEAVTLADNYLFTSRKRLILSFGQKEGQARLKEYQVEGYQKMMLTDSVHYRLHGIVQR